MYQTDSQDTTSYVDVGYHRHDFYEMLNYGTSTGFWVCREVMCEYGPLGLPIWYTDLHLYQGVINIHVKKGPRRWRDRLNLDSTED